MTFCSRFLQSGRIALSRFSVSLIFLLSASIFSLAAVFHPGVYSLTAADRNPNPAVYTNPNVAGIAIRVRWSSLEPTEGNFSWSYIDNQIQLARQNGKRISLDIIGAGNAAPEWLFQLGTTFFPYYDRNPNHPTYCPPGEEATCIVSRAIIPWDRTFLTKWKNMIKAVGDRYAANTTVSYIRGATEATTNEWNLGLPETDINGNDWFSYGYTSQIELDAMKEAVDAMAKAFPNTAMWAEVGNISFDRAPQSPNNPTWVAEQITNYGFATYPNQFGVWREDIYACTPNPPVSGFWLILWQHMRRNGAQWLQAVTNTNRTPVGDPLQCLEDRSITNILQASVDVAIDYGMPYGEIYEADILRAELQPILQYAAERFAANAPQSCSLASLQVYRKSVPVNGIFAGDLARFYRVVLSGVNLASGSKIVVNGEEKYAESLASGELAFYPPYPTRVPSAQTLTIQARCPDSSLSNPLNLEIVNR